MNRKDTSPVGLYVIGIAALFMAGFLMLVIFGAQIYRNTVSVQNGNNHMRATLSYITSAVRAQDAAEAVTVAQEQLADGTQTQVLCLSDGDTGYAIRIYTSGGQLLEEYSRAEAALSPPLANVIGSTDVFEVEKDGALLHVTTEDGSVLLHLRAEER